MLFMQAKQTAADLGSRFDIAGMLQMPQCLTDGTTW